MSHFNRFGATYSQVLALYKGTVASDFGADATAGQAAINAALDNATRTLVSALPENVYRQLTEPELNLVVVRAWAGQTAATLSFFPVQQYSLRVWRIVQGAILDPRSIEKPLPNYGELAGVTVTLATGVLAFPPLTVDDQLYASYMVDVDNASYSMPGLADIVMRGAAAEVGSVIFTEGQDTWKLVDEYRNFFESAVDRLSKSTLVPSELRRARWWQDIAPQNKSPATIPWQRG